MAIALRAVGNYASGTSNIGPVVPAAQEIGDLMLLFYGTKPYSDAPTINEGWTDLGYVTDGTVAAGVDVGSMQVRVFYKIATADPENSPTVTNSTNNSSGGVIIVFSKAANETWLTPVGDGGGDASAGTDFSVTAGSGVGHTTGDMVVGGAAFRSDSAAQTSANAITISGCSLGSYTKGPATDLASTSGGDMGMTVGYLPVNSGTSSAAPVFTCTLAAAHTGSAYMVRLRVQALSAIGDTIEGIWNIRQAIGGTSQLIYHVKTTIGDTIQGIWHVRSLVTQSVQFIHNTLAGVGDTVQTIWNVLAGLVAWDTVEIVWHTRATLGDTIQSVWHTRGIIGKTSQYVWSVFTTIGKNTQSIWMVRQAIGDTIQSIWDVLVNVITVAKTVQFKWEIRKRRLTIIRVEVKDAISIIYKQVKNLNLTCGQPQRAITITTRMIEGG